VEDSSCEFRLISLYSKAEDADQKNQVIIGVTAPQGRHKKKLDPGQLAFESVMYDFKHSTSILAPVYEATDSEDEQNSNPEKRELNDKEREKYQKMLKEYMKKKRNP
jgi:hypothetical protein